MTDEQLAAMHAMLAEYHRKLAKEAALDIVRQYHADLAQRLAILRWRGHSLALIYPTKLIVPGKTLRPSFIGRHEWPHSAAHR